MEIERKEQETQTWWQKLKKNHGIMMVICCGLPLIILLIAVYGFGMERKYLFWFVLLLCPLMHLFMMKNMHGGSCCEKKSEGDKENEGDKQSQEKSRQEKKGGSCH